MLLSLDLLDSAGKQTENSDLDVKFPHCRRFNSRFPAKTRLSVALKNILSRAYYRNKFLSFLKSSLWAFINLFPVPGLIHGTPPQKSFSCQTKNIQSPWVRVVKLMRNGPSPGRSMNTHNLLLAVKNGITAFFNLLLSDQSKIITEII